MIIDVSGIELTPGYDGEKCKGNGEHIDENGNIIECCCDECDYLMCCVSTTLQCDKCTDRRCPNALNNSDFI